MKRASRTNIARLHFLAGQMKAVERMMAEKRSCTDILIQLSAVRSGIEEVAGNIVSREIENAMKKRKITRNEINTLIKTLQRTI